MGIKVMFKFVKSIQQKVKHRINRVQRNAQIIRNIQLIINSDLVRGTPALENLFKFIVKNDSTALEVATMLFSKPPIKFTHILAEGIDHCIGVNSGGVGRLPWKAPDDMAHFVRETKGKVCIVGGTTFRGFGKHILRDREIIVVTKDTQTITRASAIPNHHTAPTVDDAVMLANTLLISNTDLPREIMFIGGSSIYRQSMKWVTHVKQSIIIGVMGGGNVYRDWEYPEHVIIEIFKFPGEVINHA